MREIMVDLETLDVKNSAVVLSIGAVVWQTVGTESIITGEKGLTAIIVNRFYRTLRIDEQVNKGRTVSLDTIKFWMDADPTAREEAFIENAFRLDVETALDQFHKFAVNYADANAFWAKPATFDFPIWEDLADGFSGEVPWRYNQVYCVRTAIKEASYSASGHDYSHISGVPHTPVYDCEAQIDLLTAARVKARRRIS